MEHSCHYRIISNNPLVAQILAPHYLVSPLEETYMAVLLQVRDLVYAGHKLYTHPLSGSVKPFETPYKSVLISKHPALSGAGDPQECEIIANAIALCQSFATKESPTLTPKVLADFQLIDYSLLASGLQFDAIAGLNQNSNRS